MYVLARLRIEALDQYMLKALDVIAVTSMPSR
jgi:hypothetical protein